MLFCKKIIKKIATFNYTTWFQNFLKILDNYNLSSLRRQEIMFFEHGSLQCCAIFPYIYIYLYILIYKNS